MLWARMQEETAPEMLGLASPVRVSSIFLVFRRFSIIFDYICWWEVHGKLCNPRQISGMLRRAIRCLVPAAASQPQARLRTKTGLFVYQYIDVQSFTTHLVSRIHGTVELYAKLTEITLTMIRQLPRYV